MLQTLSLIVWMHLLISGTCSSADAMFKHAPNSDISPHTHSNWLSASISTILYPPFWYVDRICFRATISVACFWFFTISVSSDTSSRPGTASILARSTSVHCPQIKEKSVFMLASSMSYRLMIPSMLFSHLRTVPASVPAAGDFGVANVGATPFMMACLTSAPLV